MIEQSQSVTELSKALVAFHKDVKKIPKNKTGNIPTKSGGSYSYKYADLSDIMEAIKAPLSKAGLAIVQFPAPESSLVTQIMHESGEWMRASYQMRPTQDTPQSIGSSITYQRRYAIGAILSLDIDGDDDGSAASENQVVPVRTQQFSQPSGQGNGQSGTAAALPDGSYNVTVTEVYDGVSKASGKPYQKVTTDRGTGFNNTVPFRPMQGGMAYTVVVERNGIQKATTGRSVEDVLMDAPFPDEAQY